ncbi:MAG: type II toxin-antitoxin system RelE/ParE family toxin [Proteiniphilum sp.]
MVKRVEWSDLAKTQLKNIYNYYAFAVNRRLVKKIVTKITRRTDILTIHPYSGTKEPLLTEYPEEYRYLVVDNYKIIYSVYNEMVAIVSVFDCRQNPEKMEEQLKIKR